ncbi:MAG: flagellar assembly peptidoglycan hydrolase FlgJ [Pseudomonadota bacterium]
MTNTPIKTDAYTDFAQFGRLRSQAAEDPQQGLRKVAEQFEALFLHMMLKSMREASMGDPMFDSQATDTYRDLMDHQLATDLAAKRGIGIADMLVRQLSGHLPEAQSGLERIPSRPAISGGVVPPARALPPIEPMRPVPDAATAEPEPLAFASPEAFIRYMTPLAEQAGRELGVDPKALIAQAALETGWGKKILRRDDDRSSFNLFNIKADRRWQGEQAVVSTLEYEGGLPVKTAAAFRAYGSYGESFADYVAFLKNSPRYAKALESAGDPAEYVRQLQEAGYATDPNYAKKISEIMGRDVFAQARKADIKVSMLMDDME